MQPIRNRAYTLLRSSERFMKTDMIYLFKGSFWLVTSHIILALSALILASSFSRILPKEIYGNYKYIITLGSLASALSLSGIGSGVIRSVARGFDGIVRKAFRLSLLWSIGGVLAALSASVFYFLRGNTVLGYSLAIVSIGVPILNAALLYASYLTGKRLFKLQAQYAIVTAIVPTVLLIGVGYMFSTNVPLLILTYFIGHTGTAYILYRRTIRRIPATAAIDENDVRFGKHASFMNILTSIAAHIDKVFLFQIIGGEVVALYTFASAFPEQLRGVFKIINSLTHAKLSAKNLAETKRSVYHKTLFLGFFIALVVALYFFAAPFLFAVLFPNYMEIVPLSQLIAVALIASSLGVLPLQALTANGRHKELYMYNSIAPTVRIALLACGALTYGMWGVAIAHIASKTFSTICVHTLYMRATRS